MPPSSTKEAHPGTERSSTGRISSNINIFLQFIFPLPRLYFVEEIRQIFSSVIFLPRRALVKTLVSHKAVVK